MNGKKRILVLLNIAIFVFMLIIASIIIFRGYQLAFLGIKIRFYTLINPLLILILVVVLRFSLDAKIRQKIKKFPPPSIGFVYLIMVLVLTSLFFLWTMEESWYDRINTPRQSKTDTIKWRQYQQRIEKYQSEKIREKAKLDDIQQKEYHKKRLQILRKKLNLNPDNTTIRGKITKALYLSGEKKAAWEQARQLLHNNHITPDSLFVLLNDFWDNPFNIKMSELEKHLNPANLPRKRILKKKGIILFGFTKEKISTGGIFITLDDPNIFRIELDHWFAAGNPFCIIIHNNNSRSMKPTITIERDLVSTPPIKIFISTETTKITEQIKDEDSLDIKLPETSGASKQLYLLKAGKGMIKINRLEIQPTEK